MVVGTLQHFWGHVSGCAYDRVSFLVADDDRKSQIPYRNITGIVVQEDVGRFDVAVCNWLGRLVVKVTQGRENLSGPLSEDGYLLGASLF